VTALALQACGSDAKTLSEEETKRILREELPYRFEFRPVEVPEGASGSVGGRVFGPHKTVVNFAISLGSDAEPIPIGPHPDPRAAGWETFLLTSDLEERIDGKLVYGRLFKTEAQWRTAVGMVVEIEGRLCRATEGRPCPV